jgi:hypothetical protein
MEATMKNNSKIIITNKGVTPNLLIGDLFSGKGADKGGITLKDGEEENS